MSCAESGDVAAGDQAGSEGGQPGDLYIADDPELAADSRFATNPLRVRHRDDLYPLLNALFQTRTVADWRWKEGSTCSISTSSWVGWRRKYVSPTVSRSASAFHSSRAELEDRRSR